MAPYLLHFHSEHVIISETPTVWHLEQRAALHLTILDTALDIISGKEHINGRSTDTVKCQYRFSTLSTKITDMRIVRTQTGGPILKLDTNQGIHGLGEVRDGASPTYALMLKSRIIGENPCNVDKIFRQIKQFGHHARQGGGICGIEMALMDLAGKAYGVPCYQLAGGKFRDKIRCYSDTPSFKDPEEMGKVLQERMDRGFTFLKMDIGVGLLRGTPGTVSAPAGNWKPLT